MTVKRISMGLALLLACLCLCGCAQDKTPEQRDAKLLGYFTGLCLSCEYAPDVAVENPAIYKPSAWQTLLVDGEAVYVYFDESNRADYLLEGIDTDIYGYATRYGLRYVLNYRGDSEAVLEALRGISPY